MQVNLDRLDGGRLREFFRIRPDDPALAGYAPEVREPLSLEVELSRPSHGTYVMTAALRGKVFEPCRRCLRPVAVDLDDRFRLVYLEPDADERRLRNGRRKRGKRDTAEDPDVVEIPAGATRIEIGREVRDRLFLETDLYPLCEEDCRGLCPVCGRNLNEGDCGCEVPVTDARWDALRSLGARD